MTYDQDPARWSTDPDEAPELLRGAFSAGRNEGPSRNQMRSLAVKLAAASAGGAVAVGTVKAASAGNTLTTAATWSAAKIASVVVLAGSVVTGAMIWRSSSPDVAHEPSSRTRMQAPVRGADDAPADLPAADAVERVEPQATSGAVGAPEVITTQPSEQAVAPAVGAVGAPSSAAARSGTTATAEEVAPAKAAQQPAASAPATRAGVEKRAPSSALSTGSRGGVAAPKPAERTSASTGQARASSARAPRVTSSSSAELPPPSEVSLLRSAQVALQSRPREAFQLTQQHRRLYPAGEFAQERDALAIQALMRAGETDQARELAQAFIRAYPTSPHAHRFREAMGIR